MWLFVAFLAVPLIEITLFIQVGGAIGLLWTLIIVVITAILGTFLVRQQGLRTIGQLQNSFSDMRDPTEPLAHGAMILFAGALLLTPGFFTDAVGFSLMVPQIRIALFQAVRSRIKFQTFSTGHPQNPHQRPSGPHVIDGEFEEVGPEDAGASGPSGWTKH